MAFYCEECKIIYPQKKPNCPKCGDRIVEDSASEKSLVEKGYVYHKSHPAFSYQSTKPASSGAAAPSVTLNSRSVLDQIRQDFINGSSAKKDNPDTAPSAPKNNSSSNSANASTEDFFSTLTSGNAAQNSLPVQNEQISQVTNENPIFQPFTDDQNNPSRRNIRTYRPHRPIRIPWRIVLYGFLAIVAIILLVTIWNNRYAIINGILDFILSLLPIALIIGGGIYCIKRIFR